jgi:hypothetical protein
MSHKHINRLKAKLTDSENKLLDAEVRYQQRQATFEAQTLIMESRECVIHALTVEQVSLVSQKASLEDWLKASERERDENEEALEECKAEIKLLRERGVELMRSKDLLDKGERERKQREYNSKRSVLRSFKWEEETTDALVLRGAVAFWGATDALDLPNQNLRRSKEARKKILKSIIEDGFQGELHDELEKEFVKKKRFKVFALAKMSDLESKFNGEGIGSISHCEPGHVKHMRGLIPSATSLNNCHRRMNRKATELGLSIMPESNTWCWGDDQGVHLREGVNRYVKAVYYDKWDSRVTADDPYIVVLTGDLARVSLNGKSVTMCGAKEADRRLASQKLTGNDNMSQSRTLYVPAIGGYATEGQLMPMFEELVELFIEIEKNQFIIVDGTRYDDVNIKILVVADMSFLHKFTGQGGGSASTTHFCMFCSCMSKFRNQGEPGGCERCRLAGSVYDDKGIQVCLHHDHATEERTERRRVRLNHLRDKLSGQMPLRKKPIWEDKAGLRLACLKSCVPGLRTLDGRPAYDPEDVERIKRMTVTQCEAWLNARFEGMVFRIDSFVV